MRDNIFTIQLDEKMKGRARKASSTSSIIHSRNTLFIHLFELLKAFNEKLLIVFANIRL